MSHTFDGNAKIDDAAKAGFDAGWSRALEEAALIADAYQEHAWGNSAEECAAEQIARLIREFAAIPAPVMAKERT